MAWRACENEAGQRRCEGADDRPANLHLSFAHAEPAQPVQLFSSPGHGHGNAVLSGVSGELHEHRQAGISRTPVANYVTSLTPWRM